VLVKANGVTTSSPESSAYKTLAARRDEKSDHEGIIEPAGEFAASSELQDLEIPKQPRDVSSSATAL
jgi:hypothetical protein